MQLRAMLPAVHAESWAVVVTTLALVLYGVLQERVMTRGWGPGGELFTHSSFLVLSNRLLTVAVLLAHSLAAGHSFVPVAPLRSYCLVSASNMVSTLCQYEALRYVSFVAATLAKTAKALPVVLWGTLVGGKRYSTRQYAHAILVTGGCSMFVLGGDVTAGSGAATAAAAAIGHSSARGYAAGGLLLLAYLAADGWTSTQQEGLFRRYATPIREQLLYTAAFSAAYSLAVSGASGQLGPALSFLVRHPDAALAVVSLSLASTVIQVCISTVLQRHGALMFALMMTSRQCISVLLSTLLFGHALSLSQWAGIAVAFSALYHQKSGGAGDRQAAQQQRGRVSAVATGQRMPHTRQSLAGLSMQQQQPQQGLDAAPMMAAAACGMAQAGANTTSSSSKAFAGGMPGTGVIQRHTSSAGGACASPLGVTIGISDRSSSLSTFKGSRSSSSGGGAGFLAPGLQFTGPFSASSVASPEPHGTSPLPLSPMVPSCASCPVAAAVAGGARELNDPRCVGVADVVPRAAAPQPRSLYRPVAVGPAGQQQAPPALHGGQLGGGPSWSPLLQQPQLAPGLQPHQGRPVLGTPPPPPPGSADTPAVLVSSAAVLPGVARKQQQPRLDLATLWSRGTGAVRVDPTTAVAMEHRDK